MNAFSESLKTARASMRRGAFRDAFALIVDVPVTRPPELFNKISLMADAGIALRDFTILEYGLYLLEQHSRDILAIPSYAPYHLFNVANLRANLLVIRESEGEKRCWYDRKLTVPTRSSYTQAADCVGVDAHLKARILTAHARFLLGLGRDWEAFGLFHQASELDAANEDAALGRAQSLADLSGTAPALENSLLREVLSQLRELSDGAEKYGNDEAVQALYEAVHDRLGSQESEQEFTYPKNTIITNTEREHSMVMYSLKNRLYLSPCAYCLRCDRAVGDAAIVGAHHAVVGGKGTDRYRRTALLIGRLTERYRSLRAALITHHRQDELPDGAQHQPHVPELEGWRPVPPATVGLLSALAGGGVIVEGLAACVATALGREVRGPVRVEHIFGSPEAPGSSLKDEANPALHALWDLWADGVTGIVEGAKLINLLSGTFNTSAVEELSLDQDLLTERAGETVGWMRNLIGYLIRMIDRDARSQTDHPPLWPLQPFVMPPT